LSWDVFFGALGLVFVAELGDKTQLAILSQTCKFRCTWPVFVGGSLALIVVTALGAVAGQLLSRVVPPQIIQVAAGIAFVIMGIMTWRESRRADDDATDCALDEGGGQRWNWRAFGSTFALLFVAELGDKTQLAVMGMASGEPSLWPVFAGGALALTAVTGLAVVGGQQLCRLVPRPKMLGTAAVLFVGLGILMGLGII